MKTLAVILLSASCLSAEMCWQKLPEGVRQEIACDNSASFASTEKPPRHPQPAWERGEVKALFLPAQTWDATTGGTEIADQIRWKKDHAVPVAEAGAGKRPE
jgi:hypothetical protein